MELKLIERIKKDRYSEPVFKEAGLIMKVKPFIKDNDYIILEISLELSDFKFKKKCFKFEKYKFWNI